VKLNDCSKTVRELAVLHVLLDAEIVDGSQVQAAAPCRQARCPSDVEFGLIWYWAA
jgi:hypothetical protein